MSPRRRGAGIQHLGFIGSHPVQLSDVPALKHLVGYPVGYIAGYPAGNLVGDLVGHLPPNPPAHMVGHLLYNLTHCLVGYLDDNLLYYLDDNLLYYEAGYLLCYRVDDLLCLSHPWCLNYYENITREPSRIYSKTGRSPEAGLLDERSIRQFDGCDP